VLFHILGNPIYIGKVVHKEVEHEGEHPPLIHPELWARVQQRITDNRVTRGRARNGSPTSLLAGVLRDGLGRRMTPSHAVKKGKRYRYYITHAAELRAGEPQAWRMPASDLEAAVAGRLVQYLSDHRELARLAGTSPSASQLRALLDRADHIVAILQAAAGQRPILGRLLLKVTVHEASLILLIDAAQLAGLLEVPAPASDEPLQLLTSASKVRQGTATKLVLAVSSAGQSRRDNNLIALLAEAAAARAAVLAAPYKSLRVLAAEQGRCRHRLAKLVRLSWLSPELTAAITEGRVPHNLTPRRLLDKEQSLDWAIQEDGLDVR
jgi:hypothetical protein